MCRRVQQTHTDSDDLFKFAKEHARKNMCGQTDNKLDVLLLAYGWCTQLKKEWRKEFPSTT